MQIFIAAARRLQSYPTSPYAVFILTWHLRQALAFGDGERSSSYITRYAWRAADGLENWSNGIKHDRLPVAGLYWRFVGPFPQPLRPSIHPSSPEGDASMQPRVGGLKSIATVVTIARPDYKIELVGIDDIDRHRTYHLRLTPASDPQKYNLRDLWIDTQNSDIWKAHFIRSYADSPADVTTYLLTIAGYRIVSRAAWTYTGLGGTYSYNWQMNEIAFVTTLPGWLFDSDAYKQHEKAGEADYLSPILDRARAQSEPLPTPDPWL